MDQDDFLVTVVLTEEQRRHLIAETGISTTALKVTSELVLERAVEEKPLKHIRACPVAAVDLG